MIPPIIPIIIITMYHMMYFPHPIIDILSIISLNLKAAPSSSYKAMFAVAMLASKPNISANIAPMIVVTPNPINAVGSITLVLPINVAIDDKAPIEITITGIMKYTIETTITFRLSTIIVPQSSNSGSSS